jgi:hypothetical protein
MTETPGNSLHTYFVGNNPAPLDTHGSWKLDETGSFNDTWKEMEKKSKQLALVTSQFKRVISGIERNSDATRYRLEQPFKTTTVVPAVL